MMFSFFSIDKVLKNMFLVLSIFVVVIRVWWVGFLFFIVIEYII